MPPPLTTRKKKQRENKKEYNREIPRDPDHLQAPSSGSQEFNFRTARPLMKVTRVTHCNPKAQKRKTKRKGKTLQTHPYIITSCQSRGQTKKRSKPKKVEREPQKKRKKETERKRTSTTKRKKTKSLNKKGDSQKRKQTSKSNTKKIKIKILNSF